MEEKKQQVTKVRKMYIPEIGDRFTLARDWVFTVYSEKRNEELIKILDKSYIHNWRESMTKSWPFKLVAGTELKVDRVYIRKGASDYSSLSFFIDNATDKELQKIRFWAKLDEVNSMFIDRDSVKKKIDDRVQIFYDLDYTKRYVWYNMMYSHLHEPLNFKDHVENKEVTRVKCLVDEKDTLCYIGIDVEFSKLDRDNLPKMVEWKLKKISDNISDNHDTLVTKCDLVATDLVTKEEIGRSQTLGGIKKKVKEYYN